MFFINLQRNKGTIGFAVAQEKHIDRLFRLKIYGVCNRILHTVLPAKAFRSQKGGKRDQKSKQDRKKGDGA